MFSLSGKVALISGTGGGIGRAAALQFAALGAKIVGCDVKPDEAEQTVRLVADAGGEMVSLHPVDAADMAAAERWAAMAEDRFGGIDILYNNAGGITGRSAFADTTIDEWNACIRNELTVAFTCTSAVWPRLIRRGGGVVISTGSISGHVETMPVHAPIHGVTKAGVIAFARMLAAEGAAHNIRSVSISPGLVRSPTMSARMEGASPLAAKLGAKVPLGRPADCDEIARVAAFIASDAASYINGSDVLVDGGFTGVSFTPY